VDASVIHRSIGRRPGGLRQAVCGLSILVGTLSAAGTAWCQVPPRGPPAPEDEPPKPEYDDVEQKPLSEAEYQKARERRAQEEAASRHQAGADEVEAPPSLGTGMVTRFEMGVRSGVGIPFGAASGDASDDMSALMSTQIPIWGDIGARFGNLFFGVQASYGFATLASGIKGACDQDRALGFSVDCRGADTRVGFELLYHFQTSPYVDLWFGGGLGWEWLSINIAESLQGQTQKASISANGMQLFMAQFGVDFKPTETLGIGPFLALSSDMFFTVSTRCSGACAGVASGDSTIQNPSVHHWLLLGVRASFRP
jgi:hypothetical protein